MPRPKKKSEPPIWITAQEVSLMLRCDEKTVRNSWERWGLHMYRRPGSQRLFFDKNQIEDFQRNCAVR